MFELFFKYPLSVFSKGTLVLLGGWPKSLLWAAIALAAVGLAVLIRQRSAGSARVTGIRSAVVWLLQTFLAAVLLLMLWHPALSVATLRPQQNIIAVVLDNSASMAIADEGGASRRNRAVSVLDSGLIESLKQRFQVRLYRLSDHLERIDRLDQVTASAPVTHIGESLKEVLADAASLPIGAVVLLSDGADNSGGIDLETITQIRQQRIPIHTVGFGRERFLKDIEISDAQLPARVLADSRLTAQVTLRQYGYVREKARLTV